MPLRGCGLIDVAMIEEIAEQNGIRCIHENCQIEQVISKHTGDTRSGHTP